MRFLLSTFSLCLLCVGSVALAADELPRRKSGLWRIERITQGAPSPMGAMEMCIDEKTDDLMRERFAGREQKCEKMSFAREGAGYRISSVCKLERTVATTEGKFTGSFEVGLSRRAACRLRAADP